MFSSAKAIQLGAGTILEGRSASSTVSTLSSNQYINGSVARTYITSDYASYYSQINGQHQFWTAPSGTAGTTATFTQVLALNKDQTIALQGAALSNGCGITFPATQVSSTNANTLDDYEEGTFTPTDVSGSNLTFTNNSGYYIKIGRVVHCCMGLRYPSTTDGATARISLPFPVAAINNAGGGSINYNYNGSGTPSTTLTPLPNQWNGSATCNLIQWSSSSGAPNSYCSLYIFGILVTYISDV
jgi:hypothetical protein